MSSVLQRAIAWANEQNDAYTLRVCLVSGGYFEVKVGSDGHFTRHQPGTEFDGEPVFFNEDQIESVQVLW